MNGFIVNYALGIERKLKVQKTFRRRIGRLIYAQFTCCVQGVNYLFRDVLKKKLISKQGDLQAESFCI